MNASAPAKAPEPGLNPVYGTRDDLARALNPANAYERLLIAAMAEAWQRLQEAYEIQRRVFAHTDPFELITKDLDRFKAVTRYVTDCDRIWRRANEDLRRAQKDRLAQPQQPAHRPRPAVLPQKPVAQNPVPQKPVLHATPAKPVKPDATLVSSANGPDQTTHPRDP